MKLYERIGSWLRQLFWGLASSGLTTGIALAVLVGIAAGLGAVAFRWLIERFQSLFFDGGERVFGALGEYYVILLPVLGGLIVGFIVYFFAGEAKGHGVPEVIAGLPSGAGVSATGYQLP